MKVPMIATKAMTYATRRLRADEPFEATRAHARVLSALGRAKLVEAKPEAKAETKPEQKSAPKRSALDHDGDGRKGGSPKGETATRRRGRTSPAAKGETATRRRGRTSPAAKGED